VLKSLEKTLFRSVNPQNNLWDERAEKPIAPAKSGLRSVSGDVAELKIAVVRNPVSDRDNLTASRCDYSPGG